MIDRIDGWLGSLTEVGECAPFSEGLLIDAR